MPSLTFKLRIDTDNAAFEGENLGPETARILRALADRLESGEAQGRSEASRGGDFRWFQTLRDVNGNDVGRAAFKPSNE